MTPPVRPRRLQLDALERALDRAAGARPIPGNAIRLLFDGPDTFEAMLDMILGATRWIHLDNYIIRDDATGRRFAEALMARAGDGVRVRVSSDWLGSFGTGRRFWNRMRGAGVAVRLFNQPRLLDLPSLLSRNHRKLVVADGQTAIVGGLCIGDEWAGDPARGRPPWRDTAVRIDGPAAAAVDRAFARTWREIGEPLPPDELIGAVEVRGDSEVRVLVGEPVRERAYRVTELLLAAAADRVWITDAYLVAPQRLYRALMDAAIEGVDVRLLVPGTSDLPFVRNLTRFGYRDLLRAGLRIFEWVGPMLHAKTVVADNRWVRIGSSNLNRSSLVANYELDVLIDSPGIADLMEARYRHDLHKAAEVAMRPVRAPERLQRVLPNALQIREPAEAGQPRLPRRLRERRGGSMLALRTLMASTRLAIFGPLSILLAVVATLFFLVPHFMAVLFGIFSIWLALVSGAEAIRRRAEPPEYPDQ